MKSAEPIDRLRPGFALMRADWIPLAGITALATLFFALRLAAPNDFLDQDQERPAIYVLDAIKNGNWICQRDVTGDISSKPPFYTWLCALISLASGRISILAMWLPGAVAAWGTACLIFLCGRRYFGARAAFFAAVATMATTAGVKEFALARTDGVFAFTVTAAALLAFQAWTRGGGWTWFWLVAAISTLTKGPLGPVLAAGGLLAAAWEKKSGARLEFKGSHLPGVALFLLIAAGWFSLAYYYYGQPLIDKMIGHELVGQAVASGGKHIPGSLFYQPPFYYLGRAAPWSLLAYFGFWQVWRRPAIELEERRFERFLFCWFILGLVIFMLALHQRADLLWPIMPAGALLAGRELERISERFGTRRFDRLFTVFIALMLGGFIWYYFGPRARMGITRQSVALSRLAAEFEKLAGPEFPLTHADAPRGLQVLLNTWRPKISFERAAELLRGPEPAFIAVNNLAKLETARKAGDPPLYRTLSNSGATNRNFTQIVSNRSTLGRSNDFAFCFGELLVKAAGATLVEATERAITFAPARAQAEVTITNEGREPRKVRLGFVGGRAFQPQERFLQPGEIWHIIHNS